MSTIASRVSGTTGYQFDQLFNRALSCTERSAEIWLTKARETERALPTEKIHSIDDKRLYSNNLTPVLLELSPDAITDLTLGSVKRTWTVIPSCVSHLRLIDRTIDRIVVYDSATPPEHLHPCRAAGTALLRRRGFGSRRSMRNPYTDECMLYVPHTLQSLVMSNCKSTKEDQAIDVAEFPVALEVLVVSHTELMLPARPVYPPELKVLRLTATSWGLAQAVLPDTLELLTLRGCEGRVLPTRLPRALHAMEVYGCDITRLPLLPQTLVALGCQENARLTWLPELPNGLKVLLCDGTSVDSLEFVPVGLEKMSYTNGHTADPPVLPDVNEWWDGCNKWNGIDNACFAESAWLQHDARFARFVCRWLQGKHECSGGTCSVVRRLTPAAMWRVVCMYQSSWPRHRCAATWRCIHDELIAVVSLRG